MSPGSSIPARKSTDLLLCPLLSSPHLSLKTFYCSLHSAHHKRGGREGVISEINILTIWGKGRESSFWSCFLNFRAFFWETIKPLLKTILETLAEMNARKRKEVKKYG